MVGRALAQLGAVLGHAQPKEEAGDFVGVVGEVLRPQGRVHQGGGAASGDAIQNRQHLAGEFRVIVGDRIAFADFHLRLGAEALRSHLRRAPDPPVHFLAHGRVQGADGAGHLHCFRNDVAAVAPLDGADGHHHRGGAQVHLPRHHRLQAIDDLRRGGYGVNPAPGHGAVRLDSLHQNPQAVGSRQKALWPVGDAAHGIGEDMQAEDGARRIVALQHALLDHQVGAALFALRCAFLRRLEDELDIAGQVGAQGRQRAGHAQEDGKVGVMAAGMHHARLHAAPLGGDLGGIGQAGLLGDRQRVHVGTQGHSGPGPAALQHRHHARMGDALLDVLLRKAQEPQLLDDFRRRLELAVAQLRVGVEVMAQGHHCLAPFGNGCVQPGLPVGAQEALPFRRLRRRRCQGPKGQQQRREEQQPLHLAGPGSHC